MTKTPTYISWVAMLQRCNNPKGPAYHNYGGRGIKVCDRWLKFENFLCDMGERPEGMSIEREDNDKGYELGNCKWATVKEQSRNRRTNRRLTYNGETKTVVEWSETVGISAGIIGSRLYAGWTIERALTEPVNHKRGQHERYR
ncbi:hypothetical protein KAR91_06135 [Candidatus Pacearchaeota archaeon]|nr:hypothetical protein [Candidatus Pacearchaeota archaeon]